MDYPPAESPLTNDRPRVDQLATDMGVELRRLWRAVMRGAEHPPGLEGIARSQFWVLASLASGPRRMSDLAECSQTSQTSLTGIVDRLEERGLVTRCRQEGDRRVVEVCLTEKGAEVTKVSNDEYFARVERLLEPLGIKEREELLRLVRAITHRG